MDNYQEPQSSGANQNLKRKWFIKSSKDSENPIDQILNYPHINKFQSDGEFCCSDGNIVEPLIDGKATMQYLYNQLKTMREVKLGNGDVECRLWIANWIINDVYLLGQNTHSQRLPELLLEAAEVGVEICILGSGHPLSGFESFLKTIPHENIHGVVDNRLLNIGSHHQKFYVMQIDNEWFAVVGSVDLNRNRWDDNQHILKNPIREHEKPTHELAVKIIGPAVEDIAQVFMARWNDETNIKYVGCINPIVLKPKINIPNIQHELATCSIQVLCTYAVNESYGYKWSKKGEFGIWRAYLNAINKAQDYIYIEDQYFLDGGISQPNAWFGTPGVSTMLMESLVNALKRGVHVIVMVPAKSEDIVAGVQLFQRNLCVNMMLEADPERFMICSLKVGETETFVHSKLMIVDDEVAFVGSANFCRRSMTHDSEIQVAILDSSNGFVERLRIALLMEHLNLTDEGELSQEELQPLVSHAKQGAPWIKLLKENNYGGGRLFDYVPKTQESNLLGTLTPFSVTTTAVDPYGGPENFPPVDK